MVLSVIIFILQISSFNYVVLFTYYKLSIYYYTAMFYNYFKEMSSLFNSSGAAKVRTTHGFLSGNNNNQNKYDYLAHYLAGLLEGDGHFNVPKKLTSKSGRARVAAIETVFALKDRPSAELFKSLLGGNIYERPLKNCVRWLVQDRKSVTNIVNTINGKLRTPKINALHDMIDFLNAKGKEEEIQKLPLDNSPLGSNAWLSGFIDADGYFAIKGFTSNPKSFSINTTNYR